MNTPNSRRALFFLIAFLSLSKTVHARKTGLETDAVRIPPVFWYEHDAQTDRTFLMAFLLYWQSQDAENSFKLIAPLYYSSKGPDESMRVLLPIHYRSTAKNSSTTLWGPYFEKTNLTARSRFVVPLFWDYKPFDKTLESHQLLFPIYYKTEDDRQKSVVSPFFWIYKDTEVSQGLVPPYLWRKTDESAFEVGFPLYWRFFKKESDGINDIQVAVPWFRLRSKTWSLRSFFPLYWGSSREKSSWDIFFPLVYHTKTADGFEKTVSPLYSKFTDPDGKVYGHGLLSFYSHEPWGGKTEGFFPFFLYRDELARTKFRFLFYNVEQENDGEHFNTSLFPLFKYKRDADRRQFLTPIAYWDGDSDGTRGYFANLFWRTDAENKKFFFFPLAWHSRSHSGSTTVFPPLLAFHQDEDYRFSMVAPFYFRRQKGDDVLKVVFPFVSRVSPERTWRGLFFLYWKTDKPDRHAVTLLPLFRHSSFPGGTSLYLPGMYVLNADSGTQGVAGIYLWDHRGRTQYNILPPVYWDFRRPTWSVKTFIPFYKFRSEEIVEKGFFPLIAKTDPVQSDSPDVPRHFLANSHRVLPFYFYRDLEHGHDLWLPFILGRFEKGLNSKKEEVSRGRIFLLSYWERTPKTYLNRLDPVYSYYRTPESKGFSLPTAPFPLWKYEVTDRDDPNKKAVQGALFPYYWKENKTFRRDFVLPVFYKSKLMTEDGTEVKSKKTWLLLYFDSQKPQEQKSVSFFAPLYFKFRNKDRLTRIFPPVWTDKSDTKSRQIVFPVFFRSADTAQDRQTIFFPGYWSSKDSASSSMLAGPVFRKEDFKTKEKMTLTFPLYLHLKSPKHDLAYAFPLYFRHQHQEYDSRILFPIFWNFKDQTSEVRVIPPYFSVESKTEHTKTTGVAPLWSLIRSTENQAMNFQFLGGLVGVEKDAEGKKEFTILYLFKI